MRSRPVDLVTVAIRLSSVSVAWSLAIGVVAVLAGVSAHSVALIGFGLESFIDGSASTMLVWRFRIQRTQPARAERVERTAERGVAITLLVVAVFLMIQSARALAAHTHTRLLREVWGFDEPDKAHYVRFHMAALRRKLEPDPTAPRYFRTERGVGFVFSPPP